MLNGKVTYSSENFGNPILGLVSALATITGLFVLFEWSYNHKSEKTGVFQRFMESCGRNSVIILCTHLIFILSFRVLESVFGMTIHTFPAIIVFVVTVILELLIINFIPRKLLIMFGK